MQGSCQNPNSPFYHRIPATSVEASMNRQQRMNEQPSLRAEHGGSAIAGVYDCKLATRTAGLAIRVFVCGPEVAGGATIPTPPATIIVSVEKEVPASIGEEALTARQSSCSGQIVPRGSLSNQQGWSGNHDPLFTSIGPDDWETIKCLLVFVEIG